MSTFTEPAPWRTPAAVRLALYALFALGGAVLVFCSALTLLDLGSRHTTSDVRTYRGVDALVIDGASDVRLTSAPAGDELRVGTRVTEGLSTPDRDSQQRGGTLMLSASCGWFGDCEVGYDIAVPAGTAIHVDASGGDVHATDLTSTVPVELESSGGDVGIDGVTAPELFLSSSAGDVEATGVRSERLTVSSSAGDVDLSLRTAPRSVDAESSAGDVALILPDEVYRLDASSSAGDVDTRRVRTDPSSRRVVRVESSAGDVVVEARRATARSRPSARSAPARAERSPREP
jgi:Putative adhesin